MISFGLIVSLILVGDGESLDRQFKSQAICAYLGLDVIGFCICKKVRSHFLFWVVK